MKHLSVIVMVITALLGMTSVSNSTEVTLRWESPTTNDDGTPLTDLQGYVANVRRNHLEGDENLAWTTVRTTDTTVTFSNIEYDRGYLFYLNAVDTSGNMSKSVPLSFVKYSDGSVQYCTINKK